MNQFVKLIAVTEQPTDVIYTAFRNCYSNVPPQEVWESIQNGEIPKDIVDNFIDEKLSTGHNSPLRLVNFVFIVDGVSRAMTAQFNRHMIGIGREEVSQRYVDFSKGLKNFIIPESFNNTMALEDYGYREGVTVTEAFKEITEVIQEFYEMCVDAGIPKEDARFALPMATTSREVVSFTFEALQHFIDLRTCHRAQWEIRTTANLMLKEVKKAYPVLGKKLGTKCLSHRLGYCDEDYGAYCACKRSKIRPHKKHIEEFTKKWKETNND